MMNTETETFSKVQNENKTKLFRIKTEWGKDSFQLFVIEGEAAWFALVAKDYIKKLADQHELEHTAYLNNIQKYLTVTDTESISFNIVNNQFIIYHTNEKEKHRVKYFLVKLEKADYRKTMEMFVDTLILKHTQLLKDIDVLGTERLEAESKKILYEQKCDQFTEMKRKSDLEIYSAFTLILNEKKRRIRFLSELLDSDYGAKIQNNNAVKKKQVEIENSSNNFVISQAKPSTSKARETISDTDSDSNHGYNTDDEKEKSTVKHSFDDSFDDAPSIPVLPKRFKHNGSTVSSNTVNNTKDFSKQAEETENVKRKSPVAVDQTKQIEDNSDEEFNTQAFLDEF